MNPKQFLQIGGVILLLLAVIGFLKPDIGGEFLTFWPWENWAHLGLGVVAIVVSPLAIGELKKWIVVLVGLIALAFGVLGFMVSGTPSPNFYGIVNLDNPIDNVLHLVVGVWALFAAFKK
ncbi:MAG: hypothetical protein HOO67_01645 [Candidatus Peribacteraceae bacterium]|nr:hypothetical protein [Candidatus Peribacteraceae bacterium]